MKSFGVILFLVGLALMLLMILMNPVAFLGEYYIYESNQNIVGNRGLITLLGSTLTIVGTLMAIFCKKTSEQIKTCQFCLEESDSKVKKCKHCGEMFTEKS